MMELTRSEAIEQHRDMWDRIFRYCNERYDSKTVPNAKKIKRTILREMNGGRMPVLHSDCYLCEYAHPEGCQKCPLEWGILCYVKGGLFQQFCQAKNYKEAAYFALRIRDLRERIEKELEEKQEEELFISKVMGCMGKFKEVFRFMRELEKRFSIRFNVEGNTGIAKVRIEAIRSATGEMIDAFEYHIVEVDRIQSDMEDLEKKLIETDQITKTKEVVKILDDYARSKGWNCYFGNLETCKSSEILRAVLLSHKEEHPRFVSFYLGNSIETIKKQIEGIRLI